MRFSPPPSDQLNLVAMVLLPLADKAVLSNPFQDGPGLLHSSLARRLSPTMPKIPVLCLKLAISSIISPFPHPRCRFFATAYRWKQSSPSRDAGNPGICRRNCDRIRCSHINSIAPIRALPERCIRVCVAQALPTQSTRYARRGARYALPTMAPPNMYAPFGSHLNSRDDCDYGTN
ncbi:hypothetical protein F4803DRAFT_409415 [Xylaria telfairii]|nr:hypothetical protein F4803DRAFT_409415 [Xylaria telfairii]